MLKDKDVNLVVAEEFGANMIEALEEKSIKTKELHDIIVKEALNKCQDQED